MNNLIVSCPACGTKNRIPAEKSHLQPQCGSCGQKMNLSKNGSVIELDDNGFENFTSKSSIPVMVDFFSPTCGPCRMLAPVIASLAKQYAGRVHIAKLDTSRNQFAAGRHQIRGVPTLVFFKNGKVVDQIVGAAAQDQIEEKLNKLL